MSIEKQTYRSGPFKNIFAQGVRVGDILYLAGQVGVDASGDAGADVTEQTKLAYSNIRRVLSKFNATMSNIVDETMFVTDIEEIMSNSDSIFAARADAYGEVPEVSQTLVQVSALVLPKLKLEIKCIAHL
ncbi:MAG: RidA family protein [Gammaproteobacteria bacterium]|nr:RidA family protein [Gammaproteobacteria bacterium]RZV37384.1 MAG: RidA family protein [Acidimicrobiales bacterium]